MNDASSQQQWIGGRLVVAASGQTLETYDPASGTIIARVPASGPEDVERAVAAAARAFESWRRTTPQERSRALLRLADALEARAGELGRLESRNAGKPIRAALDEMAICVDLLRFFAGAARVMEGKAAGEYLPGHTSMIRREPLGVVVGIPPWNYPLYMATWKMAPAIAAGNTVVLKPSSLTPLTALAFAEIASEHLPPGVLNVITGRSEDVGDALVTHPQVRMISLTGDTRTGRHVARLAADSVKRLHLELGGKAPVIVFDDADIDLAAAKIKEFGFWNCGQDCAAATRVLAGPKVYERLVATVAAQVRTITWGDPAEDEDLFMGSLIGPAQVDRVEGMVERARPAAEIVVGGSRPNRRGAFYEPTVIAAPDQASEIVQQEVFGPVVTIQRFEDEETAVRWANDVRFGLSASAFTSDISRAMRVSKALDFGTVWINEHYTLPAEMPFGGVKESGYGRDGSAYALEDYTFVKHVMINTD
ncbi:MAG: aminobutyraldehyde dehydrogenase [Candidatus Limnocylindrales bacterium]